MDISFLFATKNDTPHVRYVIDNINSTPTRYSYEICVYSPFEVQGQNVVWLKEDKLRGPLYGCNYLFKNIAKGEYMACVVDELIFDPAFGGFDPAIDLLKSDEFKNKQFKITTFSCPGGISQELPQKTWRWGNIIAVNEDAWPEGIMMRFPVLHRDTILNYLDGYLFHPELRYHAGDTWLGCYMSLMGEPGMECLNARLKHIPLPAPAPRNTDWSNVDGDIVYCLLKNFQFGCKYYVAPEIRQPWYSPSSDRYVNMHDHRLYPGDVWHRPGGIHCVSILNGRQITVAQDNMERGIA